MTVSIFDKIKIEKYLLCFVAGRLNLDSLRLWNYDWNLRMNYVTF
jgi:hypothetical protein